MCSRCCYLQGTHVSPQYYGRSSYKSMVLCNLNLDALFKWKNEYTVTTFRRNTSQKSMVLCNLVAFFRGRARETQTRVARRDVGRSEANHNALSKQACSLDYNWLPQSTKQQTRPTVRLIPLLHHQRDHRLLRARQEATSAAASARRAHAAARPRPPPARSAASALQQARPPLQQRAQGSSKLAPSAPRCSAHASRRWPLAPGRC